MLEPAPAPHPLHGLQGHLPLWGCDLHPPESRQGLGPLHRLRPLRFCLPQRLHRPLAGAGPAGHGPRRQRQRHRLDRLREKHPQEHPRPGLRIGPLVGGAGLPGPEQKDRAGPDPLRRVRERRLRRTSAQRAHPSGGIFRPASLRGSVHPGLRAGCGPFPQQGILPPRDDGAGDGRLQGGHEAAAPDAARPAGR